MDGSEGGGAFEFRVKDLGSIAFQIMNWYIRQKELADSKTGRVSSLGFRVKALGISQASIEVQYSVLKFNTVRDGRLRISQKTF